MGPFFFDGNVNVKTYFNGQSYLKSLNDELIPLMAVLIQNQFYKNRFQHLRWAQDGAPCHELLVVRARQNQIF